MRLFHDIRTIGDICKNIQIFRKICVIIFTKSRSSHKEIVIRAINSEIIGDLTSVYNKLKYEIIEVIYHK